MKKVPQEAGERLARDRWQFFERLFGALRLSGQRVMERSLQGAVEGQAEAVRGADGEVLLRACPGCGTMERRDFLRNGYYERKLVTSEGVVSLRVPRLRCRCGKSLRVEHLGFGHRQRFSYEFQLAVVEQLGMRVALRPLAQHFARRGLHISPPPWHAWCNASNCPHSGRCRSHRARSASTGCTCISGTKSYRRAGRATQLAS